MISHRAFLAQVPHIVTNNILRSTIKAIVPHVVVAIALTVATAAGGPAATDESGVFTIARAICLRTFSDLAWSADGRRFAFVVADPDTTASTTNYDVYAADRAGGTVRQLTRNALGDGSPAFSPGGDTLAYVSTRAGDSRPAIWMMPMRGGEP